MRYTIQDLKEMSDKELILSIIQERKGQCTNYHSPLYERLTKLYQSVKDDEISNNDNSERKSIKLHHHKTTGGAEYLTDTFIISKANNGKLHKEGTITNNTQYVVRIDGDITKDAELMI